MKKKVFRIKTEEEVRTMDLVDEVDYFKAFKEETLTGIVEATKNFELSFICGIDCLFQVHGLTEKYTEQLKYSSDARAINTVLLYLEQKEL
jgi:hypothetical protein